MGVVLDADKRIGAVCLGTFDGVHLGHQEIFRQAKAIANGKNFLAAVFTFYPHPGQAVGRAFSQTISTRKQRAALITASGIDLLVEHPFTSEFSALGPENFVRDILLPQFRGATMVVGFNYTFGHRALGNVSVLRSLGEKYDFEVVEVNPVLVDGQVVSSTRLRRDIALGNMDAVRLCLGREFSLAGSVSRGDGRGHTLGFPTANLHLSSEQVLPPCGVYTVYSKKWGYGVGNLGRRPTFPQTEITFEVHFFQSPGDLYGEEIEVELIRFQRPEIKFVNPSALQQKVSEDIAEAVCHSLAHSASKC